MSILSYFDGGNRNTLSDCRPVVPKEIPAALAREHTERMVNKLNASEITITFTAAWDVIEDDEIIRFISEYFRCLPLSSLREVLLVAEYGETNRLHFHGIIVGKPKELSQLNKWLRRRFGRTTLRTIKHAEAYAAYMWKETPTSAIWIDYTGETVLL